MKHFESIPIQIHSNFILHFNMNISGCITAAYMNIQSIFVLWAHLCKLMSHLLHTATVPSHLLWTSCVLWITAASGLYPSSQLKAVDRLSFFKYFTLLIKIENIICWKQTYICDVPKSWAQWKLVSMLDVERTGYIWAPLNSININTVWFK